MKKTIQNIAGYVLGGVMFVVLLPTIMWLVSGMPDMAVHIGALRASLTGLLMLGGLTLSMWTIVYMKRRGKGNPMDAFGHEVAPRTQHLMTDGPYRINRNGWHIRKDGKPVTSAQVYACICRYPSIFTKEAGRICVML